MSSADIRTFLSLSTAHLTPASRLRMDQWCGAIDLSRRSLSPDGPPTLMAASDYGWFVYVTDDTEGLPADLADCIEYARNEDCAYILFDADAPEDTSMPTYDDAVQTDTI
jgi:hypothetical protein